MTPEHIVYPPDGKAPGLSDLLENIIATQEVQALWLLPIAYYRASQYECMDLAATSSLGTEAAVQKCRNARLNLCRARARSLSTTVEVWAWDALFCALGPPAEHTVYDLPTWLELNAQKRATMGEAS
ncbi:hypothetical protein FB451DRAFT_1185793 [Mycena latifolia]|nr:hypothetical protein FB451DRAFT_1185793 [Mycena latifolia]